MNQFLLWWELCLFFLFLSLVYHGEKFFVKINTALFFISCLLQFSLRDNVQDLRQVVLDRPESCHRTCFSLQIDGVRLDDFAELHMIEGLKDGAVVKVVEGTFRVPNFCKSLMCIQPLSPPSNKITLPLVTAHDLPRLQIVFINVQGLKYGSHSTGQEFISLLYNNNLGAKQFTLDLKQFLKSD